MEKPKLILIVDDEMDMRIFLSTIAKICGYASMAAKDGKEGMEKARDAKPDLLILDVMMPGEGGIQMYRQIRTDENLKETPIIMLSAIAKKTFYHYLSMLNVRMGESIPEPQAYIEKPPEAEELMAIIKSILEKA